MPARLIFFCPRPTDNSQISLIFGDTKLPLQQRHTEQGGTSLTKTQDRRGGHTAGLGRLAQVLMLRPLYSQPLLAWMSADENGELGVPWRITILSEFMEEFSGPAYISTQSRIWPSLIISPLSGR